MRIELSTWPAVERYFDQGNDLVMMAIGSTEEHGRHNPLGTDTLAPNLLLDLIEQDTDEAGTPVLIAPTIPFGNADDLLGFPGTLSAMTCCATSWQSSPISSTTMVPAAS